MDKCEEIDPSFKHPNKIDERHFDFDEPATYDMSIHDNPEALAWAEFYKKTFPDADESLMHTWFANAMMAMHDSIHRTTVKELEAQVNFCARYISETDGVARHSTDLIGETLKFIQDEAAKAK